MIEMMGLFDCVASFGIPVDIGPIKTQRINLGKKLNLPTQVKAAYHLVAIHETRKGFEPTLVDPRYEEIWFAGTHKDIGGGYQERGMADLTLKYMFDKADKHGVLFSSDPTSDIDMLTPGPEMYLFRAEETEKLQDDMRILSVGTYGEPPTQAVKLHASTPGWENTHERTVAIENIDTIFTE